MYFSIFFIYIVLLNCITTYRLVNSDCYDTVQKSIQFLIIWMIPLIGVLIIASFLNQIPLELNSFWKKYSKTAKYLSMPFFIAIKKNKSTVRNDEDGNAIGGCYCGSHYEVDSAGGFGGGD